MTKRSFCITLCISLFLLMLSCGGNSLRDCSDESIVKNIYAQISANKDLSSQIKTIDVTSENGKVKVIGWTIDDKSWKLFKSLVEKTECVVGSDLNGLLKQRPPENHPLRPTPGDSCVPGTVRCGDLCIPEGERCNIK